MHLDIPGSPAPASPPPPLHCLLSTRSRHHISHFPPPKAFLHGITESFRVEKTSKIYEVQPSTAMFTIKPCPQRPHPHTF